MIMKATLKTKWGFYCAIVCLMGGSSLFFYWINHSSPSSASSSSSLSSPAGQSIVARDPSFHAPVSVQKPLTNDSSALAGVSTAIQKNPSAAKEHSKPDSGFDKGNPGIPTPDYLQRAEELSCAETEPLKDRLT